MSDYQTHVFTSTYTADVSGVCSAMYELGGMTIIHDPSGCNSTYSTHDEPRWFDSDSLMFVSGLDEMTAVLGDDTVLLKDAAAAAADLKPRFITLCSGSIPHIISFDCKGVAHLLEKETGIPVLPVVTTGNRSYLNGVGAALTEWIKRFGNPEESPYRNETPVLSVNLLGVTPLDFSVNGNVKALQAAFENSGIPVNCCAAMGESFDSLSHIFRGAVNVVVSSAGRRPARYMEQVAGIPRVEGLPIGSDAHSQLISLVQEAFQAKITSAPAQDTGKSTGSSLRDLLSKKKVESVPSLSAQNPVHPRWDIPEGQILIIGEEVFGQSLAYAINQLPKPDRQGLSAYAVWPDTDHGFPEEELIHLIRKSQIVIGDPLYQVIPRSADTHFVDFPHEAYSGRIYRKDIPVFAGPEFSVAELISNKNL